MITTVRPITIIIIVVLLWRPNGLFNPPPMRK